MILIKDIAIVDGYEESKIKKGSILIKNNEIISVNYKNDINTENYDEENIDIIDGSNKYVLPGIINHHTHGITRSPLMASAAPALSKDKVIENLNKHLLQGTTTILSVDGFATMESVIEANNLTPINVKTTTAHLPINFEAAKATDGSGLKEEHLILTVEKMIKDGAVAIGEVGAGVTLGGAGQDYLYIPLAIKEVTGKDLNPSECKELKEAVLGRYINTENYNESKLKEVLNKLDLSDYLTIGEAKKLIEKTVLSGFNLALKGIEEATNEAMRLNVPILVHNAAASFDQVRKSVINMDSELTFIACHSNHPTFELQEAINCTRELRDLGAIIDIGTLDCFETQKLIPNPDTLFSLLKHDLVDLISTDYGGGNFDSILKAIEGAVEKQYVTLQKAVNMATKKVTEIIPRLAPNRGVIEEGKIADLTIVNKNKISEVIYVIINGEIVLKKGELL